MASPKKRQKSALRKKQSPKRETNREILRKLFPPQVVEHVDTQLKEYDDKDEK